MGWELSFRLAVLGMAFIALLRAGFNALERRRKRILEQTHRSHGAVTNSDGSTTYSEDGLAVTQRVDATGVDAGEFPIFVAVNMVVLNGIGATLGRVRIVEKRSAWWENNYQRVFEGTLGVSSGCFVAKLPFAPGYAALVTRPDEAVYAAHVVGTLRPVMKERRSRSLFGWPIVWMDLLPTPEGSWLGVFALAPAVDLYKRATMRSLDRLTVTAARALQARYAPRSTGVRSVRSPTLHRQKG